jgi:glycosyltransferase involved in cell wall biosynthesis
MKKVLFVITKSYFGGAQRYVFDLATALKKEGYDVAVILGGHGVLKEKLGAENIRTISIPSLQRDVNPIKDVRTFFALLSVIRTEKPDVLHVNSAKAGGLGALAGRILRVPRVIFTMHGFAFNENRGWVSKKLIATFTWLTVILSDRSIAVSDTLATFVPRLLQKKIAVIKNGVRPIDFKSREDARAFLFEKCAGLSARNTADTFWIVTIAELHPIKGLPYAIEAINILRKSHPNICYVVMSGGEMQEALEAQTRSLKLEGTVLLSGFVTDAAEYLTAFDAFLLPSLSEGLGYVLLEAGLAHLPIVATNVGGIPEVITDGESGILVPPKSPEKIADALKRYMENPKIRHAHVAKQAESMERHFSFNEMVEKTIVLYFPKG